ncbi:aldo/keto reductase [Arthrobacter agilis]|uniref:aldo/keto reductase n=1 Tax=Arthrobacter agilis TaxID=37921 RepID=UPI000B35975E|nr:aldo/keto reductase [Arthrobacter agilis]OUM44484.1 aldo/keto reductase [Arthrobacter agilis]PPB47387.1 aldo/keto reductase [Arthrobacter agilis]TPV22823.1 aldo/keto reductase [Arthrobacter agilis]VDR32073.1 General stress protein 69 [Arthrobacter agilis]
MQRRNVGESGLSVSALGLGTMNWGQEVNEEAAREQLRLFVEAGGTLVESAARYGEGQAEALLGGFINDTVARSELVLVVQGGTTRSGSRRLDGSRRGLLDSLDASLSLLGTDHVDVWLAPSPDPIVPLHETLSALEAAYSSGRARYVGVSNYSGWEFARAAATAGFPLVVNDVEYSLLNRGAEREVVPAAAASGAAILAWGALGRGVLTGKYRGRIPSESRGASDVWSPYIEPYLSGKPQRITEAVCTASRGLDLQPHELALRWMLHRPGVASAIVGARTPQQLKEILQSGSAPMAGPIAEVLDEVSAIAP